MRALISTFTIDKLITPFHAALDKYRQQYSSRPISQTGLPNNGQDRYSGIDSASKSNQRRMNTYKRASSRLKRSTKVMTRRFITIAITTKKYLRVPSNPQDRHIRRKQHYSRAVRRSNHRIAESRRTDDHLDLHIQRIKIHQGISRNKVPETAAIQEP